MTSVYGRLEYAKVRKDSKRNWPAAQVLPGAGRQHGKRVEKHPLAKAVIDILHRGDRAAGWFCCHQDIEKFIYSQEAGKGAIREGRGFR
jgi:hypothetical protein